MSAEKFLVRQSGNGIVLRNTSDNYHRQHKFIGNNRQNSKRFFSLLDWGQIWCQLNCRMTMSTKNRRPEKSVKLMRHSTTVKHWHLEHLMTTSYSCSFYSDNTCNNLSNNKRITFRRTSIPQFGGI